MKFLNLTLRNILILKIKINYVIFLQKKLVKTLQAFNVYILYMFQDKFTF